MDDKSTKINGKIPSKCWKFSYFKDEWIEIDCKYLTDYILRINKNKNKFPIYEATCRYSMQPSSIHIEKEKNKIYIKEKGTIDDVGGYYDYNEKYIIEE